MARPIAEDRSRRGRQPSAFRIIPHIPAAQRAKFSAVRADPAEGWRQETRARKLELANGRGARVSARATTEAIDAALERVINKPDLLPAWWLVEGRNRADAVAQLRTPIENATGFLVSPWLLVTNNHVLPDRETADETTILFRYELDARNTMRRTQSVRLDPARCFITNSAKKLDYTVVAVHRMANGKAPGAVFGSIPVRGAIGKIAIGEPVNIVQHPDGRAKEMAVRNNLLVEIVGKRFLTYETDTEVGSSGAPVFNDAWQLVALHSRGESAKNADGEEVDIEGNLVTTATHESRRKWVANRGTRISALVADLKSRRLAANGSDAESLILELLTLGGNT